MVKLLGWETIYPLQQRVAKKAMRMILANERPDTPNKRSPIITLQPQMGKTGALAELTSLFIDDCVKQNMTFQVIVVCGLPHLDLTEQTKDRLTEAFKSDGETRIGARLDMKARSTPLLRLPSKLLTEGIIVQHNSVKLKSLDLRVPVDRRLFIGDEVHLGNVKGGNIDVMLRNHGIRLSEQIHTWDNSRTKNHFVGVSATPSAHMIQSDNFDGLDGESLFSWIYEAPSPEYNSLHIMLKNGRLCPTQPLFVNSGDPSSFLTQVQKRFERACQEKGPGHLVIRATGKKHSALMTYINRRGRKTECRTFDSDPSNQNIDELNAFLATKPSEPVIVVIKGSMRAGITLAQDHYIRGWVETESINSDSQAQSGVGRACGYGRTKDTYPIYCDLKHIKAWAAAYDSMDKGSTKFDIPSGVQNHKSRSCQRFPWKGIIDSMEEAHDKLVKPYSQIDKRDANGKKVNGKGAVRRQISSTADQVKLNVADLALTQQRDSGATVAYYINGPTTKKAVHAFLKRRHTKETEAEAWALYEQNCASYADLIKKHPEVEGKVIELDIGEANTGVPVMDRRPRNSLQKKTSALKAQTRD